MTILIFFEQYKPWTFDTKNKEVTRNNGNSNAWNKLVWWWMESKKL